MTGSRVLMAWLGERAVDCRLGMFENHFGLTTLDAADCNELNSKLAAMVRRRGPIDACVLLVDTAHLQPLNDEHFQSLLRSCRLIVAVSPGRKALTLEPGDSDTPVARAEAVIETAISFILAIVGEPCYSETFVSNEEDRNIILPDRHNLVLGIMGMGGIGRCLAKKAALHKVRVKYFDFHRLSIDDEAAYQTWYCASPQALLAASDIVLSCPPTEPPYSSAGNISGKRNPLPIRNVASQTNLSGDCVLKSPY